MSALSDPFDAAIFDMDGTLLDTETVFRAIVFEVVSDLGYEMRDEVHSRMVGSSHEATEKLLVESYGVTFPYQLFDERCRDLMHARTEKEAVPAKPGARQLLGALREHDIPLAVATSSRARHAHLHLEAAGLLDHFTTVVTRDDVSMPKPDPEPYLLAAERLSAPPARCIAFEDSRSGVHAAHAAGMRTIMVPDIVAPDPEISGMCAAVLDSLAHAHAQLPERFHVASDNDCHLKTKR